MKAKYQRTYHLPWSEGLESDDKKIPNLLLNKFVGKEVIVTEKLDGENTTLYSDYIHARSMDSIHNFTRDWVKKMHSVICQDIPENWRMVGENLWAEHSIRYENLMGYFYLFAIFDESNVLMDYDEMSEYAEILDIPMPKVFGRFIYNKEELINIANNINTQETEGYVIRLKEAVPQNSNNDFLQGVAKFVRNGHVQTNEHWLKNAKQNGNLNEIVKPYFMK